MQTEILTDTLEGELEARVGIEPDAIIENK